MQEKTVDREPVSWCGREFSVFGYEADWKEVGGVYVFSGFRLTSGFQQRWIPYYIGSTGSFRTRIPNHEMWPEAKRLGATHVHARVEQQEKRRLELEEILIRTHQPPLNVRLK